MSVDRAEELQAKVNSLRMRLTMAREHHEALESKMEEMRKEYFEALREYKRLRGKYPK